MFRYGTNIIWIRGRDYLLIIMNFPDYIPCSGIWNQEDGHIGAPGLMHSLLVCGISLKKALSLPPKMTLKNLKGRPYISGVSYKYPHAFMSGCTKQKKNKVKC